MSRRCDEPARDGEHGLCAVCGDIGEVAVVLRGPPDELGRVGVRFEDGRQAAVALDLVDARPGERVLVHLGFAIGKASVG